MTHPLRIVAMISGTGSNLAMVLDTVKAGDLDLDVVEVISNRAEAPGLDRAREHGVATRVIGRHNAGPEGEDAALAQRLNDLDPDLILLTGYMRILGADLVNAFTGRMINQHPSLLPRHKGLHTHRRAIEAGDREHGASVHFVTPELDGGPVIAQVRVPVEPDDDEAHLARRVAPRERALLLALLPMFTGRRLALENGTVLLDGKPLDAPMTLEGDTLHA
jgi:phosphoribosylglycinamide formyltransferase-1